MKNIFKQILDIFFYIFWVPEEELVLNEIYLNKTEHYKDELGNLWLDSIHVCLEYEQNLKKLLRSYKYDYNKKLDRRFSNYLNSYGELIINESNKKDIIVCGIPLYFVNYLKRGYNQTYLLARLFSKEFGLDFERLVYKKKHTKSQSKLDRDDRLKNVEGSFDIKAKFKDKLASKTIILIDDVISSGSTSNELAKILKQNGAKKVIGLFLSSGN